MKTDGQTDRKTMIKQNASNLSIHKKKEKKIWIHNHVIT